MPTLGFLRIVGKFVLFLLRRLPPAGAWWLARHDAPISQDYRGLSVDALRAAWLAAGDWKDLEASSGRICSRRLQIAFTCDDLLARHYPVLCDLAARGFRVEREGPRLILSNDRLVVGVATDEEVSMLREIFVEQCYRFHLEGEWSVLDIGANVGFASLFFASQPWVARVDAFEPFDPTAEAFAENLRRNPAVRGKVTLWRHGLGESDAEVTVDYHAALRGSMSVTGLGTWRGPDAGATEKVTARIRRISDNLDELSPAFAGRPLLAKIDCEGSEFGILRDLEQSGWLSRIDVIVMEWHQHRPDELLACLARAGYAQHVRDLAPDGSLGLVTAVRRRAAL